MSHHEGFFTARDGLPLYEQWWLPEREPCANIVLVHGVMEHSGRYEHLAAEINQHSYGVYTMDLRGHGRSEGPRAWIESFDQYIDDVDLLIQRVAERQPGKPLFLLGHSMGGAVAALTAIDRKPPVRGVVLSAPAVVIAGGVFPILRRLASFVSRLWPKLRLVRLGCRFISRDPAVVEQFRNDPLVFHGRFPVRTGAEILRAAGRIQTDAQCIAQPMLVLHGTGDFVTDPAGSRLLIARSGSADKTLRLYTGLYHDVFHEPERAQVITDLLAWLNGHL